MKKLFLALCMFLSIGTAQAASNFNILDRAALHNYFVDVALGTIPNATLVSVFGYSPNTGSVTNVNVWETATAWTTLTSASAMELLSSSANDAAAGTGCQLVSTQGLDNNYNQISELVVPNGTSVVALVNSYIVINSSVCVLAGSTNSNVGNITTRVASAGSQQGYIAAAAGASRHGRFTVPAGYSMIFENFFLMGNKSGNPNSTVATITEVILPGGTRFQGLPLTIPNGSNPTITVPTGVVLSEKQTIAFKIGSVSTTGIDMSVGASAVLIKNP